MRITFLPFHSLRGEIAVFFIHHDRILTGKIGPANALNLVDALQLQLRVDRFAGVVYDCDFLAGFLDRLPCFGILRTAGSHG
ncbi:hypothetical protein D3C74_392990 [compost metagenome]